MIIYEEIFIVKITVAFCSRAINRHFISYVKFMLQELKCAIIKITMFLNRIDLADSLFLHY